MKLNKPCLECGSNEWDIMPANPLHGANNYFGCLGCPVIRTITSKDLTEKEKNLLKGN